MAFLITYEVLLNAAINVKGYHDELSRSVQDSDWPLDYQTITSP